VERHLRSAAGVDAEEVALRVSASGGSLGVALSLESQGYREIRERLLGLLESVGPARPVERMVLAEALAEQDDHEAVLGILRSLLRDVAALRAGVPRLLNPDLGERLGILAGGPLGDRATALAEDAAEAREALKGNANKLLTMDLLLESLGR
jgi:hypothetical protein